MVVAEVAREVVVLTWDVVVLLLVEVAIVVDIEAIEDEDIPHTRDDQEMSSELYGPLIIEAWLSLETNQKGECVKILPKKIGEDNGRWMNLSIHDYLGTYLDSWRLMDGARA